MVGSAQDMQEDVLGLLPTIDRHSETADRPDFGCAARRQRPPTAAPVPRATFLDRIDSCVRHFAAMLAAGQPDANGAPTAEFARVQLWSWLHDDEAVLDDGRPIDFAVFDAAIQRVGERLPRRGLPGQENVLRAAWLLAELTHASALPDAAQVPALARTA